MRLSQSNLVTSLVALIVMLAVTALPSRAVKAATECGGTNTVHDGLYRFGTGVRDAKANIPTRAIYFCTGGSGYSHSDVSAWSMVTGDGSLEWAQIGYGKHRYDSATTYFAEVSTANYPEDYWRQGGNEASGTSNFRVVYNETTDRMRMYRNDILFYETTWNPFTKWGTSWGHQWMGETHVNGDDMPGTSSNRTTFDPLLVYPCRSGCSWSVPSGLSLDNGNSTRYGFYWVDADTFQIWTK